MVPGDLLRERRLAHGVSQRELALRAGTRQSTISRLETGGESPTIERLAGLLLALGEELGIVTTPLSPARSNDDIVADRAKGMAGRLEDGFALAAFASQLAGAARR